MNGLCPCRKIRVSESCGQMGGRKEHALAPYEAQARALLAAQPDLTLDEFQMALASAGMKIGRSSIGPAHHLLPLRRMRQTARRRWLWSTLSESARASTHARIYAHP